MQDRGVWRVLAGTYKVLVVKLSAQIELAGEIKNRKNCDGKAVITES